MDAYRKHLAAAEAYGARARAHRARAERHRSLAFGGQRWLEPGWLQPDEEEAEPVNDADWTFEWPNHLDLITGRSGRYASVARDDGTYVDVDETGIIVIGDKELQKYYGRKWEDIPPHIQKGVIEGPPSVQEERKKEYDKYLLSLGVTGTRP